LEHQHFADSEERHKLTALVIHATLPFDTDKSWQKDRFSWHRQNNGLFHAVGPFFHSNEQLGVHIPKAFEG
jgi:hypothetical protein